MISSRDCSRSFPIKNHMIVEGSNISSCETICSTILEESSPVWLIFTQYVVKVGNNLVYNIYINNKFKCNIHNIQLKDILPKGVEFVSTSIEYGQYRYCKDKIFYHVPIIRANYYCKIVLNIYPTTSGEKINLIGFLM